MAFLVKMNEIRKALEKLDRLLSDAEFSHKNDGISDQEVLKIIQTLSHHIDPLSSELKSWMEDKQSLIEELEFLTDGFRMEYGAVSDYKNFVLMIKNRDVKKELTKFGREESEHAEKLIDLIYQKGGVPEYVFVAQKKTREIPPEKVFDYLIEREKEAVLYYRNGEEKFQDAKFCWLIGEIKLEEMDHLKKLEDMKVEFEKKEIVLERDPDFKWTDPYMGEPGDRAWIE